MKCLSNTPVFTVALGMILSSVAFVATGHDTWVQSSAPLVRPGDLVHVSLGLGNHGNTHRDFKFAGKLSSLEHATIEVIAPDGRRTDLIPSVIDLGYAPKEGFYSARHIVAEQGLHTVAHTLDTLHHTTRAIKSGKTHFLVSESTDRPEQPEGKPLAPLGHPFELVLESHPVLDCGPGQPIAVQLLFNGAPLPDHVVSFIPRGATLSEGFDPEYERTTDADGRCHYTPREGNLVLVVTHLMKPQETGEGYDKTAYAATLVVDVPQRCACCE
jgi:uncharacterized GH25 family protein